jgi:hypothetical protein
MSNPQYPIPELDIELRDFCRRGYAPYDESHDLNHAVQVYGNAKMIVSDCHSANDEYLRAIRDTTMIHDIDDYKYRDKQTVNWAEIGEFIRSRHSPLWAERILWTVQNMSWSKQGKVDYASPHYHAGLFHVARDADWIEAIDAGRCITYQRAHGHGIEAVVAHVDEKLIHVRDRLHWDMSKLLAAEKHRVLTHWRATEGRKYQ